MEKKRVLLIVVFTAVLFMTAGYAAMAQLITVNGTAGTNNVEWDISFTEIQELSKNNATSERIPTVSGTIATFEVNLQNPGATMVYQITVKNNGTINAILDSITGLEAANSAEPIDLQYAITDISENDTLNAGESQTFKVTVTWVAEADTIPTASKIATIGLGYVQNTD